MTESEVWKTGKDSKKNTTRHGPIPSLDMAPMTKVFQVKDPALLDQLRVGDKIKFQAEKFGGQYTVIRAELAK